MYASFLRRGEASRTLNLLGSLAVLHHSRMDYLGCWAGVEDWEPAVVHGKDWVEWRVELSDCKRSGWRKSRCLLATENGNPSGKGEIYKGIAFHEILCDSVSLL